LSHPNIVQVIGAGCNDQGILYLSQVLVHGRDLRRLLEHSPSGLPPPVAIFVATQVLYALQHAHENGVLHRDVNPEDAHRSWDGHVRLTDFGNGKAVNHSNTPTISSSI